MVAEGAALSGEGKLLMNGAPFVNRGTVSCNVWLGWGEDAVFVNEGSVSSAEVWLDEGAGFARQPRRAAAHRARWCSSGTL